MLPRAHFSRKHGDGIERIAFTAVDSAAGAEEIRARGYTPIGPTDFERPVTMPDGRLSAAKFRTFQWPVAEAPGGVRIFACQHKTRETVWIPELMKHANGAKHLKQVLIVDAGPRPGRRAPLAHDRSRGEERARWRRRGAFRLGPRRLHLPDQRPARPDVIPESRLRGVAERGGAGLVIAADLAATEKALGSAGLRSNGAICVPPAAAANGTLLAFVRASLRLSMTDASALRERLLDHELRRLAVIAFDKALASQQRARVLHQRRAAADHDAVMRGLERGEADIAEQFAGIDQVGDAAAVAERDRASPSDSRSAGCARVRRSVRRSAASR